MKITSIEAIPFRLPTRRDFKWAGLKVDLGGFVLIRVRTESGVVGYGEATPLPDWGGDFGRHAGETLATVAALVNEVLGPLLIGHDVTAVTMARERMDRAVIGHVYAKCAVDIALHDAWGKIVGLPIYKLLGGACRASVPVAHMVGLMPEGEAIEEAVGAVADGITALQIKGGVDAERDVRLIGILRRELKDGICLRLDANQGYRETKTAIRVVGQLADAGADYVEQPTVGLRQMAEVTRGTAIPIIADESCWDLNDALDLDRTQGADCISIYLAKSGGFVGARKVGALAEATNRPCDVNGSIESAIGNAANVHFALATLSVSLPCVIPISAPSGTHPYRIGGHYYEDDVLSEAFVVRDGAILPLDGPGLGITIDEAKLERFRCA
ncbi:mandelate racemase/muconate lactonizing enzyme family protein [Acidisoma cladoniae]|jgi:L-alanine-DL-glutamate epimerase-like enolase superfamily enzyme|uniref:mandelate racemase/muconate lactonizing enzyme family protein n=1 Tax=Acidisoma cladoniae TaxID=3040935 RepID=UPI00254AB63A|nr:enolase C-terminal domain-like protein [Acidisoma sp. PAMC 29798]